MNKKVPLLLLLIPFAFAACNQGKSLAEYGNKFADIMRTRDGMFRGIELGKSVKEIKAAEDSTKKKEEESNYLYYEFPGDTGELYSLEYNFDANQLTEVRLDAYFIAPADARALFIAFRDYYTAKFGKTEQFEGFAAWAFKAPDGKKIQLEMTDESAEYRQGKFSFVLYFVPDDPSAPLPKKS